MIVYDTGALIAAERGGRPMLALHTRMLQRRIRPVVPAPVLAQAWRGGSQVTLSRVLTGCRTEEGFSEAEARRIGGWLAQSGTKDVVGAHVVAVAAREPGSVIYTADIDDITLLVDAADQDVTVLPVPGGA